MQTQRCLQQNAGLKALAWSADIAAVAEGQVIYHSSKRLPYGGQDLDQYLHRVLEQQGIQCHSLHALQKLKEACTRIASPDTSAAEVGHTIAQLDLTANSGLNQVGNRACASMQTQHLVFSKSLLLKWPQTLHLRSTFA